MATCNTAGPRCVLLTDDSTMYIWSPDEGARKHMNGSIFDQRTFDGIPGKSLSNLQHAIRLEQSLHPLVSFVSLANAVRSLDIRQNGTANSLFSFSQPVRSVLQYQTSFNHVLAATDEHLLLMVKTAYSSSPLFYVVLFLIVPAVFTTGAKDIRYPQSSLAQRPLVCGHDMMQFYSGQEICNDMDYNVVVGASSKPSASQVVVVTQQQKHQQGLTSSLPDIYAYRRD